MPQTPRVKLGARWQITIPKATIERLDLKVGEEFEVADNGRVITLAPQKRMPRTRIPKDQLWYHTKTWQRMMREAFDDVRAGRVRGPFESVEELIKDLRS